MFSNFDRNLPIVVHVISHLSDKMSLVNRRKHDSVFGTMSGDVLYISSNESADLLYFGGPWTDYQCHSETTSNYIISSECSKPRSMRLS